MHRIPIVVALSVAAVAARAQQPAPARPATANCPLYVVDGQIVSSPGDCASARPSPRKVDPITGYPTPDVAMPAPADDPLARFLFPPELVMAHQEAIGLTDKQRMGIQDALKETQSKLLDLQFKMAAEVEKLQRLIQATSPDEPKVLDEVNRVLTLERDVKVTQMTLMVRIKSQLTERQQSQLNQMRGQPTPRPGEN